MARVAPDHARGFGYSVYAGLVNPTIPPADPSELIALILAASLVAHSDYRPRHLCRAVVRLALARGAPLVGQGGARTPARARLLGRMVRAAESFRVDVQPAPCAGIRTRK